MTYPPRLGAALVAALLILSTSPPVPGGTIRHDRDPQQFLTLAQSPDYASAGLFRISRNEPGFTGSGVLVGDRWVLTAGHLLEGATGMTFTVGGRDYAADGWVAHPRFDGDFRKGYDIGLVRLSETVGDITPAVLNRSRREQNQIGTFVGFGRTGDGINGGQPLDQVDFLGRAGTNAIDGTVDTKLGFGQYKPKLNGSRVFVADFDSPVAPPVNVTGSPVPTELEFLIAQGDSGGPVFIDVGQGPVVAGIHSFGEFRDERDDSDYGDITGHTRVSSHRGWVLKTINRFDAGRGVPDFVNVGGMPMELPPVGAAVVPEPATAAGMMLLLMPLLCRRWGRRRRHPAH